LTACTDGQKQSNQAQGPKMTQEPHHVDTTLGALNLASNARSGLSRICCMDRLGLWVDNRVELE